MVEKECIWKKVSQDKESTTRVDMLKNKDVKCFKCVGWDDKCSKKIQR